MEKFKDSELKINYPEMILHKSEGVSSSEKYLKNKCEKTFLSLWSYPNLYTQEKKGKELCDVLVLFEDHICIFSDKYCDFQEDKPINVAWNRWFRHTIRNASKQIMGAERYLRKKLPVFLDAKNTQIFPLSINITEKTKIHRIIIARGIKKACIDYFGDGNGSLMVDTDIIGDAHYNSSEEEQSEMGLSLFKVGLIRDRENYIHVFDDFTLDCILEELDTVSDFLAYLENKESIIQSGTNILAAGEEEILGKYMNTIENNRHCIATTEELKKYNCICIDEGIWNDYYNSNIRKVKKKEDKNSYIWDALLERTFYYLMSGTVRDLSHPNYDQQSLLFSKFAKFTRMERRRIAKDLIISQKKAIKRILNKDNNDIALFRRIIFDHLPDTMLIIMWMHYPVDIIGLDEYYSARKNLLNAKLMLCAKENKSIRYFLGVGKTIEIDLDGSEDFAYLDSYDLSESEEEIWQDLEIFSKLSTFTESSQRLSFNEFEKPENVGKSNLDYE